MSSALQPHRRLGSWDKKKRYIHCVFRISSAMCVCFLFLCASVFYSSWCNHITGRPCSQWWWAGDRWRNYRTYHESIFIAVAASIIFEAPCLKRGWLTFKSSLVWNWPIIVLFLVFWGQFLVHAFECVSMWCQLGCHCVQPFYNLAAFQVFM